MLAAVKPEDAVEWANGNLDEDGSRALHIALDSPAEGLPQMQLVRVLLAHRADPNAIDGRGLAPLHLGAQHSSKYVLRALLCAGADNSVRTQDGRTTIDCAQCNPNPIETYEVLGWPGQEPLKDPLPPVPGTPEWKAWKEGRKASAPAAMSEGGEAAAGLA